jgi:hypothetical protein
VIFGVRSQAALCVSDLSRDRRPPLPPALDQPRDRLVVQRQAGVGIAEPPQEPRASSVPFRRWKPADTVQSSEACGAQLGSLVWTAYFCPISATN